MVVTSDNNIIYGGPIENDEANSVNSLGELVLNRFNKVEEKVVLVDGVTGREIIAKELKENFLNVSRNLESLGVKDGDTVGICCENRLEFAYCMFGAMMINATFAPFNATYTENELNHVLGLSKPKVVFVSSSTLEKVYSVAERCPFIQYVISFDGALPAKKLLPFTQFRRIYKGHPGEPFRVRPTNKNENIAVIMCSSGTTGVPKGVQMTQRNMLNGDRRRLMETILPEGTVVLTAVPWVHISGYWTLMMFTSLGSKIVFLQKFQLHQYLNCIQHYQITVAPMVPSLIVLLTKHPLVDKYDLSSIQLVISTTSNLTKESIKAFQNRTGVPNVFQGYFLTETTVGLLTQDAEHWIPGSVGTIKAGAYVKVIDVDTGAALGPNKNGELCFESDTIMKGYIGDQKSTNETIDNDGWLHTGDVGYYDENFNFYLVDRIKELIEYKGHQVAPAEIEALLITNPKVKDAAVIGVPDEVSGELPMAFVVKEDQGLTEKDVFDFVAENFSRSKWLHGGVRFIDEVPRNSTSQIMRRFLRDQLKRELNSKL